MNTKTTKLLRTRVLNSSKRANGFFNPVLALALIALILTSGLGVAYVYQARTKSSGPELLGASVNTIVYTALQGSDVANEDGGQFTSVKRGGTGWLGTGETVDKSYLGVRFGGRKLPTDAKVLSAKVFFTSPSEQWMNMGFNISAENSVLPETFSTSKRPSSRVLLSKSKTIQEDVKWEAGKSYSYDVTDPVVEAFKLSKDVSYVALVIKGTGGQWGRKAISFGKSTPRLVISYEVPVTPTVTPGPSTTPVPTTTPVVTVTPAPTATPTTVPTATATPRPTVTATPVVTSTPVVTATPVPTQTPTPVPTQVGGTSGTLSHAIGMWDPATAYFTQTGPQKYDRCSKSLHDSYNVLGPDGKVYPTWHPAVVLNSSTGRKCSFGHEHGRDPSKYHLWETIRRHFAYDANNDGTIQDSELTRSGVPFGYVNEQLDSASMGFMRHEDHVGHKIEYVNGELDTGGEDRFDNSTTGGIVIPLINPNPGEKWLRSGVTCYMFHKIHQGVHSPDAFTNNLHEAILHSKCTSTRSDYPNSEALISGFIGFGNAGEFTRFCGDNRDLIIKIGTDANNSKFPGGSFGSMRNIFTRDCVEKEVLVPAGTWSTFPYEIWSGDVTLRRADGSTLAILGGGWEVLDAIRYYDPNVTNRIRYVADTCYEVLSDGRMARGGTCSWMTDYGRLTDIKWNDTRSGFKGLHRGQYMGPPTINNRGGSTTWYTDAFGNKASTSRFAGSVKQFITSTNSSIQFNADPRNALRQHDDGEGTVYAPN